MLMKLLRAFFSPAGSSAAGRLAARALELRRQGDLRAAETLLREAVTAAPRDAVTAVNLALVLLEQGQAAAGAAELERALALDSTSGAAHYNYANLLRNSGRPDEALAHFRCAAQAQPPVPLARQELMFALLDACLWDEAEAVAVQLRALCNARPPGWMAEIAPLTAYSLGLDADACKAVAAWHAQQATAGVAPLQRPPRAAGKRLRLGYLSPDLREHPVGFLMSAALPLHDRERFEVFAYSSGEDDGSDCRRRIAAAVDHFVDIQSMSDAEAAARIAADGIDVLIDLAGHTTGSRLGILARRPAPVQAHYLGYAGTTGAAYIDYFISDAITTPPQHAAAFTEQLARVPGCFMVSGGPGEAVQTAPLRAAEGLPADAMVFANFTGAARTTRADFVRWLRILQAVPQSVLWLKHAPASTLANLRAEAQRAGIDPARLAFARRAPGRAEHLARLALADLVLDTIDWHNGHSTTNELLWAGVPVLTAAGGQFAARVGASLLTAAGLPELVARDAEHYVASAIRHGNDRKLCAALKIRLAVNRGSAPFFDQRRIVAGLEAAILQMAALLR